MQPGPRWPCPRRPARSGPQPAALTEARQTAGDATAPRSPGAREGVAETDTARGGAAGSGPQGRPLTRPCLGHRTPRQPAPPYVTATRPAKPREPAHRNCVTGVGGDLREGGEAGAGPWRPPTVTHFRLAAAIPRVKILRLNATGAITEAESDFRLNLVY